MDAILNPIFNEMLIDFLFIIAGTLVALSLVVGLLLMLSPERVLRFNNGLRRRYSMRQATKGLEIPHPIEHIFYRFHKLFGVIITLCAAYVFHYMALRFDPIVFAQLTSDQYFVVAVILAETLKLFLLFTSVIAIVVGCVIFARPSTLKLFENWSNQWVSTRMASRSLSKEHSQVDDLVSRHPTISGILVTVLSLYAGISLILIYI